MVRNRILIVDDDPNILKLLEKLLIANGLQPEAFSSPRELLKSVSPDDKGCVVTDLEMPEMSGMELQSALLELGSCLSVIVITGHADVPSAIKVMGRGAVMMLEKPFESSELVAQIEQGIKLSHQAATKKNRIKSAKDAINRLDEEEIEIMKLASQGLPNKAISYDLSLSPRTVDRRRQSAITKLGVVSVAEFAVLLASSEEDL